MPLNKRHFYLTNPLRAVFISQPPRISIFSPIILTVLKK